MAIDRDQKEGLAKAEWIQVARKKLKEAKGVEFSEVVDEAQDEDTGRNM
jgi:hypothetical protein